MGDSIINVKVITRSSKRIIEKLEDGSYRVHLTKPPEGGKANRELLESMSRHLGVSKSSVRIVRGERTRDKVLEVNV